MRIAIVNDMPMAVEALRRVVAAAPDCALAWTARDGRAAVAQCATDTPDIILMDLVMPVMNGVEATRLIMQQSPCAILVVTATVSGHAGMVFDAMGHGALDAVRTPALGAQGQLEGAAELLAKIATIRRLIAAETTTPAHAPPPSARPRATGCPLLVAIGASTGGPMALATILGRLPARMEAALVIIQHVDVQFAAGLERWLNEQSRVPMAMAVEGARPEAGHAYLAATNDHLVLRPDFAFHYTPDPKSYPFRPSANVFFESLVHADVTPGVAVLLTGMGDDGARGLLTLAHNGWHTIAQDKASSVIYGMPKAAAEMGAAREILPVADIAAAITARLPQRKESP